MLDFILNILRILTFGIFQPHTSASKNAAARTDHTVDTTQNPIMAPSSAANNTDDHVSDEDTVPEDDKPHIQASNEDTVSETHVPNHTVAHEPAPTESASQEHNHMDEEGVHVETTNGHDHVSESETPVQMAHSHTHNHHMEEMPQVAIPASGSNASAEDIDAYLAKLFAMDEVHSHDGNSGKLSEHEAALNLVPRSESTKVAIDTGNWFDPTIWADGEIPEDGDRILIPEGVTVRYDAVSNEEFFTVRIDGKLEFATDQDSQMIFDTMIVSPTGTLEIGTEENPVSPDVDIDLIVAANGPIDTDWDPMLLSRGLISHGRAEIHGMEKDSHEKVVDDPMAGDTFVTFATAPEGWQVGDTIVIAGTRYDGFYKDGETTEKYAVDSEDEVRVISAIDDNTVYFEDALIHDHDTPREDLKTSVANYTRNVSIETDDADTIDVSERGHVMFMHSDDVEVRYAEFNELGRTDKSLEAFDAADFETLLSDSNVKGRYSLHIHRAGAKDDGDPAILEGNAVFGSPGWGIVHHDSHALLENNATYDTFGAGYVAESGNETGAWNDNIAIYARGMDWSSPKTSTTPDQLSEFDLANSGDGFWLQSRMVMSTNNVAASVNDGFVYYHRGAYGDGNQMHHSSDDFIFAEAVYYDDVLDSDQAPILFDSGNEVFASHTGLFVLKDIPAQDHDIRTTFNDFTAWNVFGGADLRYTSHYTLTEFDLIAREDLDHWTMPKIQSGIAYRVATADMVLADSQISGFTHGVNLNKILRNGHEGMDELHEYVIVNTEISNSLEGDIENYDPSLDTILDSVTATTPTLTLDEPLVFFPGGVVTVSGTKTDSLGETGYPNGTESFDIEIDELRDLLEINGYYDASDGERYVPLNLYFSDRYTSEVYRQTELIKLDKSFEFPERFQETTKYNGEVDFADLQALVDADAIKVLDPANHGNEVLEIDEEVADLWAALTDGQETYDDSEPVDPIPDDTPNMLEMEM